ncbi:hypothetical protein ANCCAN_00647 [Ancylostoma caninum]|uniref:Sulfatase N-terminal domain-containing protein n=1 Tax=Ancylostoma caninum TaxID=29170 RepID=A0A368H964_ANCCA|nr:hypothetical protein ANCCAN_00647 [Ancylostoma caninum]
MAKRSLPKVIKFIQDEMDGTLMEFLNKCVPHNAQTCLGKSIEGGNRAFIGLPALKPDWNYKVMCQQYLDKYNYHLHQFEAHGYRSMIAQDENIGIAFYPDCLGFNRSEANHVWRPFQLRMKESRDLRNSMEKSCNERHIEMLDYLEKFIHSYPGVPKIGQIWPTTIAHETLRDLYHADDHFLSFFEKNSKNLENAFVFIMGDHGPRREGVSINMFCLLDYYFNLTALQLSVQDIRGKLDITVCIQIKGQKKATHFIQPQTNFSDTSYRDMQPHSKGSSLLREWRGARNCRTLPIPPIYCLCQYTKTVVRDRAVQRKLGVFLAKNLNELLKKEGLEDKCYQQVYHSVSRATLRVTKMKDDNNDILYDVSVYLRPSNGLFSVSSHLKSQQILCNPNTQIF